MNSGLMAILGAEPLQQVGSAINARKADSTVTPTNTTPTNNALGAFGYYMQFAEENAAITAQSAEQPATIVPDAPPALPDVLDAQEAGYALVEQSLLLAVVVPTEAMPALMLGSSGFPLVDKPQDLAMALLKDDFTQLTLPESVQLPESVPAVPTPTFDVVAVSGYAGAQQPVLEAEALPTINVDIESTDVASTLSAGNLDIAVQQEAQLVYAANNQAIVQHEDGAVEHAAVVYGDPARVQPSVVLPAQLIPTQSKPTQSTNTYADASSLVSDSILTFIPVDAAPIIPLQRSMLYIAHMVPSNVAVQQPVVESVESQVLVQADANVVDDLLSNSTNSTNSVVLAQQMMDDHTASNQALADVADSTNIAGIVQTYQPPQQQSVQVGTADLLRENILPPSAGSLDLHQDVMAENALEAKAENITAFDLAHKNSTILSNVTADGAVQNNMAQNSALMAVTHAQHTANTNHQFQPSTFVPHPASTMSGSELAEQVRVQIRSAIKDKADYIRLQLHPAELGRMDIQLEMKEGVARLMVLVDRPETLELLQRDIRGFERTLQQAGIQTDAGNMEFNLRQPPQNAFDLSGGQSGEKSNGQNAQESAAGAHSGTVLAKENTEELNYVVQPSMGDGRVDIHI